MNYHDWLYRTRRLMVDVEAAMSEMAGHIETDDTLPNLFYSGESDARTIIHKMPELRLKLRRAFYLIGDNLPNIPGNPFLIRETTSHVNNYKHLRSSFKLLYYRLNGNPDTKAFLFSDKVDWDGLLAYFKELDEDARDILLAYVSPPDGNDGRAVDVMGMAKKLRQFLPDADDEFFDDRGSAEGEESLLISDAQRLMSTVLTAWNQWTRSVVRPTLVADFRPTPLSSLATESKAEWPWSPKQSFTAGVQPDGNVCRAELNGVEVAQARRAGAAGTKPF